MFSLHRTPSAGGVAQAGGVAVAVTWTVATACYMVALIPLGIRLIGTQTLTPPAPAG